MDTHNLDYLFDAAKDLIGSRHSIMEYSPTDDIVDLYETISFHSYNASAECMVAQGISLLAQSAGLSFPGLGVVIKYLALSANYYSMVDGINKIAGIEVLNIDTKSVANIIYDAGTEITKHTYNVYAAKFKSMIKSNKNGYSISISDFKKTIYKFIFSVAAYSDSMSFGWAYLKTIEDLFKRKVTEVDVLQLKKKVIDKIKDSSNKIESVSLYFTDKYICDLTKDIGNSEEEIYNYFYNCMQDRIAFLKYMNNIKSNELRAVILKNTTIQNAYVFILSDQLSSLIVDFFNNPLKGYTAKSIFTQRDRFSLCADMLYDMQKKYLASVVRISNQCTKEIITLYSKYASKEYEIPEANVFYEKHAEYYVLMPCAQSIEGLVNSLQKLVNKRAGYEKFEISWIVTLWGQMIADIVNSIAEEKDIENNLKSMAPYFLTCIIFYFASTDVLNQVPYNLASFKSVQAFFDKKYKNLSDILYYCPTSYYSLARYDIDTTKKEYKNLINFVLTRYVGNLF